MCTKAVLLKASTCEHSNGTLYFIQARGFLRYLSCYEIHKCMELVNDFNNVNAFSEAQFFSDSFFNNTH